MKEEKINRIILRWLIPSVVFVGVIALLLLNFSKVSKEQERIKVEEGILISGQNYADRVDEYMVSVLEAADIVSLYLANVKQDGNVDAMVKAIQGVFMIYDFIIYEEQDRSYHIGGAALDEKEKAFYGELCEQGRGMHFLNHPILNRDVFMVVSTVDEGCASQQYVLCLYNLDGIAQLLSQTEYYNQAFFVLMTREGKVLTTVQKDDCELCFKSDDYFNDLRPKLDSITPIEVMKARMESSGSCVTRIAGEEHEHTMVLCPVGEEYYLLIGVKQEYVDNMVDTAWIPVLSIAWQLVGALTVFVGIVVIVGVIGKIRNDEKSKSLENKADTDQLTGLYNKVATERKIKEYMAEHPDEKAVMFLLDIDNFKKINDTMGHAFGDEVLQTLGRQIRAEFRASDILGRVGGDEFMIFLCNMKQESIIFSEAERVERFFMHFQAGEYVKYSVTASIGAAIFPKNAQEFEDLYKNADRALYLAKSRGKNQLAFYEGE